MSKRYSIAEARQNLASIVHELESQPIIELTRRGAPVAVLLSYHTYNDLVNKQPGFWELYSAFRASIDPSVLDGNDDPFANVRDTSPGREVEL
jgi:prevent-host-death family protein